MPDYTIKHNGKEYTVRANSPEEAAAAFDAPASIPTASSGMMQAPSAAQAMSMSPDQLKQRGVMNVAQSPQDLAQMQAQGQQGAKSMLSGLAEGGRLLSDGAKQLWGNLQDDYNLFVHGKPIRKEEAVRGADGKLVTRDTTPLDTSKGAQATAEGMLRQAVSQQEAIDAGMNIPDRNFSAGAAQLAPLALAPEALLPRATTAVGAVVKNAAAGSAGSGVMFNANNGGNDALLAAGIAPVLGLVPSLVPAVKNYIGRGLARVTGAGRTAQRVASAEAVLPETSKTFSLAQRTGIPEMVTLERSAYNSKMVNHFADQTDKFVNETVDVLRQPMKPGQTLANDFVAARARADDSLRGFKRAASDNYEAGMTEAARIAARDPGGAQIPVDELRDTWAQVRQQAGDALASGGKRRISRAFENAMDGALLDTAGHPKHMNAAEVARTLKGLTALQQSEDPVTRALATRLHQSFDADLDVLERAGTQNAENAVHHILDTRMEYRRAQNLITELSDSASYKLLGVHNADNSADEALKNLKTFTTEKQTSVRHFLEENSPDLLVSLKDAAIKEAQRHAATIRAGADSQQDLNKMMDTMFDSSKGYDVRTAGLWNADELKKMEGIKDGLRVIANNRPAMAGAGTPIKAEDVAINLVSRAEAFMARQATRIFMGSKAADFFTDPEVYKYMTKINRTTTGSPVNLAARAALLDRMQTDYAEQQQEAK